MKKNKKNILNFWNNRARYGENAGSNDFMLKHLEEIEILKKIPKEAEVLDIGCGNASTLIRLATEKNCKCVGIDYAGQMLNLARQNVLRKNLSKTIILQEGNVLKIPSNIGKFKYVFTQRCLINLKNFSEQATALKNISKLLNRGGFYIMVEAFEDGNNKLNEFRRLLKLPLMTTPWHNTFFKLSQVKKIARNLPLELIEINHFASMYYFLSRVVYAKIALIKKTEMVYDSDINKVSLSIPSFGEFGATKMLLWRKK